MFIGKTTLTIIGEAKGPLRALVGTPLKDSCVFHRYIFLFTRKSPRYQDTPLSIKDTKLKQISNC